jgi:hypothetical protein
VSGGRNAKAAMNAACRKRKSRDERGFQVEMMLSPEGDRRQVSVLG